MNPVPSIFLETGRLIFRPFVRDELALLHAMHNDPDVYRFVGDSQPLDRHTAQVWIDNSRDNIARHGMGSGAIVLKATGELIGWGGFSRPDGEPPELIYGFARKHWGKGYASELIPALIALVSDRPECQPLRATVDPRNRASVHLLEKFGFKRVAQRHNGEENCDLYIRQSPPEKSHS